MAEIEQVYKDATAASHRAFRDNHNAAGLVALFAGFDGTILFRQMVLLECCNADLFFFQFQYGHLFRQETWS